MTIRDFKTPFVCVRKYRNAVSNEMKSLVLPLLQGAMVQTKNHGNNIFRYFRILKYASVLSL